eukprot:CAMPEP_0177449960 /NCGR_PEP_ID=MMETSP0369-20130122/8997_1 /TAXON_ID=447022 ORGANISM="Scrippsiella hangoei-like, Strain SHHI-4" /NCGR_SAMPLE_ID=MMETSP0369 /ASSEMBLY_ACC=CAM_ASM_000364 /LENGTH=64 /DNA_ID=CAMNT_0018922489 /DNA_START=70 /DNA_END=264 /DNA_ORIENTATION=+
MTGRAPHSVMVDQLRKFLVADAAVTISRNSLDELVQFRKGDLVAARLQHPLQPLPGDVAVAILV